jgi:DNA-binding transcriptional ArsR family regulator
MVYEPDRIDRVFQALADPTRREILRRLARSDAAVSELAQPFAMSLAAVGKHVRVLERASLVRMTRVGRYRRCQLNVAPLQEASAFIAAIEAFWTEQLHSLAEMLAEDAQSNP